MRLSKKHKAWNKKAQISGIFSGIGDIIKTAFDLIPRPVKFLMFLLLLLIIGQVIQYSLHLFGIFCNSANQPVQTHDGLFANMGLLGKIPDSRNFNLSGQNTEEIAYTTIAQEVTKCSRNIRYATIESPNGSTRNITSTAEWFYDGSTCTDCNKVFITEYDPSFSMVSVSTKQWCEGFVFPLNHSKNLWQKLVCWMACEPPTGYYYDDTSNIYVCIDEATCKKESQTLGEEWDTLLLNNGATLLYPEGNCQEIKDIETRTSFNCEGSEVSTGVVCQDYQPKISVFSIPIFDFTIWILLTLVFLLYWIYANIKK